MPDIRLDVPENNPVALEANRAGHLTTEQVERLLRELESAKRVYWSWPPLKPVWNGVYAMLVSVIGIGDDGELIYEKQDQRTHNA